MLVEVLFQDIQFFTNPGETALDVVDMQAMTLANLDGKIHPMKWGKPNKIPRNTLKDACIQYLNTKSKYKIFVAYQGGELGAWGANEQSKYTDDPFAGPWNHWPMHFVPSDGRFAVDHDRVTHFALGANDATPKFGSMVMYGFSDQGIESVIPTAKSWKNPPIVTDTKGLESMGYDKDQKAFVFKSQKTSHSFTIHSSKDNPIVNPCFVIKNWGSNRKAALFVNGNEKSSLRQGIVRDVDGSQVMILWIEMTSAKKTQFKVEKE